ncbi:hypothetical protein FIBSPDRAFT_951518 [Athelia psychrophila]|uniref:DUF6533 domain-containing protein n=1 Tax=Athelia psychrophila TaxID=1759441 RepID=A0A166MEB2_9AGAM|nr:hypothetical protein FIBSPDRAFT_951518 [Fibularhizoctonia sp. CBS 109695]
MDIDRETATRDVRIHYYIQLVSFVILLYDHIIAFPLEVKAIWRRPPSINSGLYLANRYLATIGNAAFLAIGFQTLSDKASFSPNELMFVAHFVSCQTASLWGQLLLLANQLLIRVYAIYARDRRILITFLCMGAAIVGATIFSFINQRSQPLKGFPGCTIEHTTQNAIRLAIPWECLLVYDTLILVLTVLKTYRTAHDRTEARRATSSRAVYIPTLILRDGALYFTGIALSNALNIICFYVTPPLLKGSFSSFNSVIGIVFVSRMVLSLRAAAIESHEKSHCHTAWNVGSEIFSHPQFRGPDAEDTIELSSISNPSERRSQADIGANFGPVIDISHLYPTIDRDPTQIAAR